MTGQVTGMGHLHRGVLLAIVCFGFLLAGVSHSWAAGEEATIPIYVINHNDWHTGIVIRKQDIPGDHWQERHTFRDVEFLEVGWGDHDYYRTPDPTVWMTLKAGLWPTDSVLHIIGFNLSVEGFFSGSEIVELRVSLSGLERLSRFIEDTYARDALGRVIDLGSGLYENSRFYQAQGKFHLLNTCNTWTAKAIRSAGFPVKPFYAITARNLFSQVQPHGRMIPTDSIENHESLSQVLNHLGFI